MTLYLRLGAYLAAVILCIAIGWHLGSLGPKRDLAALQAQDWKSKAQATEVALTAVQEQLTKAQAAASNNASTLQVLQSENAKIAADRDSNMELARRLLNSARPGSSAVPKAGDLPSTSHPAPNPGLGSVESMVVAAADESEECAIAYNTLLAQLKPQL